MEPLLGQDPPSTIVSRAHNRSTDSALVSFKPGVFHIPVLASALLTNAIRELSGHLPTDPALGLLYPLVVHGLVE